MANDTTLRLRFPTGATLYTQIEAPAGTMWNGSAFTVFSVASWTTFATATPETPASSGRYVCQFPTSAAAGSYVWATYLQAGGAPASSDACVASDSGFWDGATFGNTGAVAELPSPAPLGYGPIGTGSVSVSQDYPTAGNLSFKTSGGQGIGGALVLAYLASEYSASPNTATVRGQTLTLDSGSWANVINLDPGAYTLVFKADGYETTVVNLTVS